MSITIKELVDASASASGTTKRQAAAILEAAFAKAGEELRAGNEVTIRNFGRFFPKVRDARTARNPKTGEAVQVPAKTVYKFSPRGSLKA